MTGNLIDLAEQGVFDVIVHGCNCQHTMESGIAKEIKARYPEAYKADYSYTMNEDSVRAKPIMKLGNFSHATNDWRDHHGRFFTIINAYTQVNYWPRGVDHFEYASFALILRKLLVLYPDAKFGVPYIGMGLAGGDRDKIMKMLEGFATLMSKTGGSATLVKYN